MASNHVEPQEAFERLGNPHVLVLGDMILDRYTWGDAERISQEAPVIVLRADDTEDRPGGAANVCQLLRGLGAEVSCVGVAGNDLNAEALRAALSVRGIEHCGLLTDFSRSTTTKERYVGRAAHRHVHQILRVDREDTFPLSGEMEDQLLAALVELDWKQFDVVLISDYGKGVCSERILRYAIDRSREFGLPVLVDPCRCDSYARYRGAYLMKPNRYETETATGIAIRTTNDACRAAEHLRAAYDFQFVAATIDRDGIVLSGGAEASRIFPTRERSVYDITGAGDMVLAMLGLCIGSGLSPHEAIPLANVAGGLEVEQVGVVVLDRRDIARELQTQHGSFSPKVMRLEQMRATAQELREAGQKLVFTNGCFDLLHMGHVSYLQEAARLGDQLIVGVNGDASIRRLKGPERPVIGERDRAALLASLECVDFVVIFHEDTPHRLLEAIRPDVLVKGGTYRPEEVVGHEIVTAYGGEVRVTNLWNGISTSTILKSITDPAEGERKPVLAMPNLSHASDTQLAEDADMTPPLRAKSA